MKLEPGKDVYPFPPIGQIVDLAVDTGLWEMRGTIYHVAQVSPEEWVQMRGDRSKPCFRGKVMYVSYLGPDLGIGVFPAADKECDLIVRYFPPMVEA